MPLKFQFRADEIEGRAHEIFNARLCGIGRDTHRLHPRQERVSQYSITVTSWGP